MSIIFPNRVKHFALNSKGRDFAVGDIHGCFSQLQEELEQINFNEKIDRLFSVGDLVDRGTESKRCLEWLEKPWFHAVRGNHEEIFMQFCLDNLDAYYMAQVGGLWAESLTIDDRNIYAKAFAQLPIAIDVQTANGLVGIVHADCPMLSWQDFVERLAISNDQELKLLTNECLWSRKRIKNDLQTLFADVHKVIVGHSIVSQPNLLGNVQFIDTGAAYGRYLTVMELV